MSSSEQQRPNGKGKHRGTDLKYEIGLGKRKEKSEKMIEPIKCRVQI